MLLCMVLPVRAVWAQTGSQVLTGTVITNPQPVPYEGDFTIVATLNTPTGGPVPSGTVTFTLNGTVYGPATVQGGVASVQVSDLPYAIGSSYPIQAMYSGDANYQPATFPPGTYTVRKLHSGITFTFSAPYPPLIYGQVLNGSAAVVEQESAKGASTVGGTTSIYIDGVDICDLNVIDGTNQCPAGAGAGIPAGMHTIYVTYSGNQYYDNSSSLTQSFVVTPSDTQISVKSSLNPAVFGQVVTFTATMTAPYAVPTGTVAFFDGGVQVGTGTLDTSGIATWSSSTLVIGTHPITVSYAATQNFNAPSSSPPIQQVITLPPPVSNPTVTLLASSTNPSIFGQNVTFTASVGTTGAFVQIPTGTVTFKDGTTVLGSAMLDASGNAHYSTTALAIGQHPITASYAGVGSLLPSVSTTLTQIVTASLTSRGNGFLLTVTPGSVSVGVGGIATLNVNVLPLNGFNQPVQLSCTNLPDETTCMFDTTTLPVAGGNATLFVSPAAPHSCGSTTPYSVASGGSTGLPMLAAGVVVFFARRKRILKGLLLVAMLCILPALSGCGNCTDLGVKPGNYTFTVQGTSTGSSPVTQTQTIQMMVHL